MNTIRYQDDNKNLFNEVTRVKITYYTVYDYPYRVYLFSRNRGVIKSSHISPGLLFFQTLDDII